MSDNKTNSAATARRALLGGQADPATADWWVDVTKQRYTTAREMAVSAFSEKRPVAARLHFAVASTHADTLAIYYAAVGKNVESQAWAERAKVCHLRAFGPRNIIAENIGASMP